MPQAPLPRFSCPDHSCPISLPPSPLPSLCTLLPPHCLPEPSPQPPSWTWSLLPLFPPSRRWVPALGLFPIERASDPSVQPRLSLAGRDGSGVLPPTGLAAAGGKARGGVGGGLSPPRLSGSQEPGVGCSSEQCNSVGPAQEGGGGRPECWGTYLCPRLGHPAPRGVPLGTWVLWVPCRLL